MGWNKILTDEDSYGIGTNYTNAASGKHRHKHHYISTLRGNSAMSPTGAYWSILRNGKSNTANASLVDYNATTGVYQIEQEDAVESAICILPDYNTRITGYDLVFSFTDANVSTFSWHLNLWNEIDNNQLADITRDVQIDSGTVTSPGAGIIRARDYTLNVQGTGEQFVALHAKSATSAIKLTVRYNLNVYWYVEDVDFNEIINPTVPGGG